MPIIGVGEGSTPWLRGFFDSLGIEESEWMPECHATYKCGITFDGWSTKPGFESYFHPFASMLDNLTMTQFVHNVEARINGANVFAHPDRFFIATRLAAERRAPKARDSFPFDVWHGYHFDAMLLGRFLHKKALERGVRYKTCHVTHATLGADGAIASVHTKEGETIAADLFVDCSGFAGLLIDKALQTPFVSFANNLFNDAAVAIPTPMGETIPSETVSTALKHGWAWKIPLTSRFGNGYVYSTQFCSPDAAETRAARAPGPAGLGRAGAASQDADRARHPALESQLPGGRPRAGIHRASRSDRPALHPADGREFRGVSREGRSGRGGARALQRAGQRAFRGHARLHRDPLQDQYARGHGVLARQCRQSQPFG